MGIYTLPGHLQIFPGKNVDEKNHEVLFAGEHQGNISVKELSKGVYFLSLNSGNKRLSQ